MSDLDTKKIKKIAESVKTNRIDILVLVLSSTIFALLSIHFIYSIIHDWVLDTPEKTTFWVASQWVANILLIIIFFAQLVLLYFIVQQHLKSKLLLICQILAIIFHFVVLLFLILANWTTAFDAFRHEPWLDSLYDFFQTIGLVLMAFVVMIIVLSRNKQKGSDWENKIEDINPNP